MTSPSPARKGHNVVEISLTPEDVDILIQNKKIVWILSFVLSCVPFIYYLLYGLFYGYDKGVLFDKSMFIGIGVVIGVASDFVASTSIQFKDEMKTGSAFKIMCVFLAASTIIAIMMIVDAPRFLVLHDPYELYKLFIPGWLLNISMCYLSYKVITRYINEKIQHLRIV
jgi:hypothetical protein